MMDINTMDLFIISSWLKIHRRPTTGGWTVSDLRNGIFPHPGPAEAFNNFFSVEKRNSE